MIIKKIFLFLFLSIISFNNLLANENKITDIRLSTTNNNERIVLESDKKINYSTFLLKEPFRLVLDLLNTSNDVKAPSFRSNNVVDKIRIGKISQEDSRLVFDLNINTTIKNKFYLAPSETNKKHRIVIDLSFNPEDLKKEDLIGKIIEENNLYDVEPSDLNKLIDGILADNSTNSNNKSYQLNSLIDNILADNSTNNLGTIIKKSTTSNEKEYTIQAKNSYNIKNAKRQPRIIIDAGHGGKDPGAIGRSKTQEKIIALLYAKSLKAELDKTKRYKVYLTRSRDVFINLHERVSIARRYKGDLFISIHADSFTNREARGVSVYTLSQNASDTRTAKLAQKENKADIIGGLNLYGEYQDTINTLVDISRSHAMNDSKIFGNILLNEIKKDKIRTLGEGKLKYANFAVLTGADMPSILLEVGFLSNKYDEKMIRSSSYKNKMVKSIIKSIDSYFKKYPIN